MSSTPLWKLYSYSSPLISVADVQYILMAVVGLVAALVLGLSLMKVFQHIRWSHQAKALGAKPPQAFIPLKDPVFGLDYLFEMLQAGKQSRYLPLSLLRFRKLGCHTYVTNRFFFDTVHTTDPENLKSILSTNFQSFRITSSRIEAFHALIGEGILSSNGERWVRARALLRPSFTLKNMEPLAGMLERHFQSMLRNIPVDGSTFDLQHLFCCLTMDVATEFLLVHSANMLDSAEYNESDTRFVSDYTQSCLDMVRRIQMGPFQCLASLGNNQKRIEARSRIWSYVDAFVAQALKLPDKTTPGKPDLDGDRETPKYSFLQQAAQDTNDPVALRTQILHVLLASRDTTAGLLSHFFWEVSRHPEVFRKLREEVETHLHGELPNIAQLKDMTYLRWCLNETLRLYPSIPVNSREAVVDTTLPSGGGHDGKQPIFVPKGTTIFYYVYVMHRREDIFGPDAKDFRPERWENLRPGWGFLPFNGGPRICVGQQFATIEASYAIVRFMQTFSAMKGQDDKPWAELYTLALFSKHGVRVTVQHATSHVSEA